MRHLKIGEVAREAGLGVETIRYYERRGLLSEPEREPSGYRQYDESVLERLQFICRTKELGFTLSEIKELLELWHHATTQCHQVRPLARQKIEDIEGKIASLMKMKQSLQRLIDECHEQNSLTTCPLFSGLGTSERK